METIITKAFLFGLLLYLVFNGESAGKKLGAYSVAWLFSVWSGLCMIYSSTTLGQTAWWAFCLFSTLYFFTKEIVGSLELT